MICLCEYCGTMVEMNKIKIIKKHDFCKNCLDKFKLKVRKKYHAH